MIFLSQNYVKGSMIFKTMIWSSSAGSIESIFMIMWRIGSGTVMVWGNTMGKLSI